MVNTDAHGKSFAPAGKTTVAVAVGSTHQKLSMVATVANQGKTRRRIIDKAFGAEKLTECLQALIQDASKKVFLILGNLRVHRLKLVKVRVAERQEQIELFCLPSCKVPDHCTDSERYPLFTACEAMAGVIEQLSASRSKPA